MQQLTIEIPEALARRMAWLATQQKKSVQQLALERLTPLLEFAAVPGSPAAIRQAMHNSPRLSCEEVDELERAIAESSIPVSPSGEFDE